MKSFSRILAICALWLVAACAEAEDFREVSRNLGGGLGRAMVLEPTAGKPDAVFVCLHGIQSNKTWWRPLGQRLAAQGFALWAFDRPGSGASASAGPADVTATTWAAQMAQVAANAEEYYGRINTIAMGVSWGASAAVMTTTEPGNHWAGFVLCNPAFITRKDRQFRAAVLLSYLNPVTWFYEKVPLRLPLDIDDYTPNSVTRDLPYLAQKNLKLTATRRFLLETSKSKKAATKRLAIPGIPVLIIVGGSDPLVPSSKLRPALEVWCAGNSKVEVAEVPSASHAAIIEAEVALYARRIGRWTRALSVRH